MVFAPDCQANQAKFLVLKSYFAILIGFHLYKMSPKKMLFEYAIANYSQAFNELIEQ